jgi:hypothetical protein
LLQSSIAGSMPGRQYILVQMCVWKWHKSHNGKPLVQTIEPCTQCAQCAHTSGPQVFIYLLRPLQSNTKVMGRYAPQTSSSNGWLVAFDHLGAIGSWNSSQKLLSSQKFYPTGFLRIWWMKDWRKLIFYDKWLSMFVASSFTAVLIPQKPAGLDGWAGRCPIP